MDHHRFSNKIKEFFLSKIIKLKAEHYLETLFAFLVMYHLVKLMLLLKATKRCTTEKNYLPRILKIFHNKLYENKPKFSKIAKT
jgi:hypothetical protein